MSAPYTLHVAPFAEPGDPRALERADLVRDGFSWGAFLVPALWFVAHRHWLLALAAVLVVGALAGILRLAGLAPGPILMAEILLHLLIGFEASSLRRWSYARRGRPAVDVVHAANEAEAETKAFSRWLAPAAEAAATRPPPVPARYRPALGARPDGGVIGLFPDLEGRR